MTFDHFCLFLDNIPTILCTLTLVLVTRLAHRLGAWARIPEAQRWSAQHRRADVHAPVPCPLQSTAAALTGNYVGPVHHHWPFSQQPAHTCTKHAMTISILLMDILLCMEALIAKAWVPFPWPSENWKTHTFFFPNIPQNTRSLMRCSVVLWSSSPWRHQRAQSWVWCCTAGALHQRSAATTLAGKNSLKSNTTFALKMKPSNKQTKLI